MMIARYRALTLSLLILNALILLVEMMIARYRALTPSNDWQDMIRFQNVEMMIARYRALTPVTWRHFRGASCVEMMIARYRALTHFSQITRTCPFKVEMMVARSIELPPMFGSFNRLIYSNSRTPRKIATV